MSSLHYNSSSDVIIAVIYQPISRLYLNIKFLILDFDGVLTDNRVYVNQHGEETVACHRGDGWGIKLLKEASIEVIVLSTESNPVVSVRTDKLGIKCWQNCNDKGAAVKNLIEEKSINPDNVMYVGNDTNDAEAMALVGFPAAPADAHPDILQLAKIITKAKGGYGVVRELATLLIG